LEILLVSFFSKKKLDETNTSEVQSSSKGSNSNLRSVVADERLLHVEAQCERLKQQLQELNGLQWRFYVIDCRGRQTLVLRQNAAYLAFQSGLTPLFGCLSLHRA